MGSFSQKREVITLNEIIMNQIQKIAEMSTHELKENSRVVTTNSSGVNKTEIIYEENTLNAYIQAIDCLARLMVMKIETRPQIKIILNNTREVYMADEYAFLKLPKVKRIVAQKKLELSKDVGEEWAIGATEEWVNEIFYPNTRLFAANFLFNKLILINEKGRKGEGKALAQNSESSTIKSDEEIKQIAGSETEEVTSGIEDD